MKMQIVQIGNSQGVRIPKAILDAAGFEKEVEVELRGNELILRPAQRLPREGWKESTERLIAEFEQPESLWPEDMQDEFDAEWTWPEIPLDEDTKGKNDRGPLETL